MYSREDFEDFMEGMKRASDLVETVNPDVFLVSLNGGGPLFDILAIANRNVEPANAVYFPISSKIQNSADVARNCFVNFIHERGHQEKPQRILSIDEVVSGGSVGRIINSYDQARKVVARENIGKHDRKEVDKETAHLREFFPLTIIGVKEERVKPRKAYGEYISSGLIKEIPVKRILTMDDPDMHICVFDHPRTSGWKGQGYFPRVLEYKITDEYMTFLQDVARYFGVDPSTAQPQGLGRIRDDSIKYSKKPSHSVR